MKAWPPHHCTLRPTSRTRTRGDHAVEFIEQFCRITKDSIGGRAGDPMVLRDWQVNLLRALLAEDEHHLLRHRTALIGMARKNGKSALGAGLALWSLFTGEHGGEVYSCAGTRDQARIVFGTAKRMVELDPELSAMSRLYRDAIEVPDTGAVYRVLSREAGASEGLSPTFVVFDEVHVQPDDELWNVMELGGGARTEPLLLGVTTAGARTDTHGRDSLCYSLYQHGKRVAAGEVDDPSFFFAWWEPKLGAQADHRDPRVWEEGNPGYGDICSADDFTSTVNRTPEAEFRTKRTNVWTTSTTAALPFGAWDRLADPARTPDPDVDVVLMFDGSWNGDATGIVACTVEENPHMWVVGLWERPGDDSEWRVPVADVEETLRQAARDLSVVEIGGDPYGWKRSLQVLENEGLPMAEFPMNSVERMTSAWKSFFDAVMDETVSHDGDQRLSRHIDNMVLKIDNRGARPTKESKMSRRHIDLGVCAVAAHARAIARHNDRPPVVAQPRVIFL